MLASFSGDAEDAGVVHNDVPTGLLEGRSLTGHMIRIPANASSTFLQAGRGSIARRRGLTAGHLANEG
jgi:hypothetical protein